LQEKVFPSTHLKIITSQASAKSQVLSTLMPAIARNRVFFLKQYPVFFLSGNFFTVVVTGRHDTNIEGCKESCSESESRFLVRDSILFALPQKSSKESIHPDSIPGFVARLLDLHLHELRLVHSNCSIVLKVRDVTPVSTAAEIFPMIQFSLPRWRAPLNLTP
jgi:hypothetical protein